MSEGSQRGKRYGRERERERERERVENGRARENVESVRK